MSKNFYKEKALAAIQSKVNRALKRLGLVPFISIKEIEREILNVETAFQSLLLLGIIKRIMYREDDEAAKLFLPSVTEWKNYLPHDDLGGLSPFEYREKYPPGEYETMFIARLMEEYQTRLASMPEQDNEHFDINTDFSSFQKEYFERIPIEQPFQEDSGNFMTLRKIIVEERRRNGYLEDKINVIGVELFIENTTEGLGWRVAEIDDNYYSLVNELTRIKTEQHRRSQKRLCKIQKVFEETEIYHRCGPEPHRFYLNYASVLLLNGKIDKSIAFLDKALAHKSDYALAQKMKDDILLFKSSTGDSTKINKK